MVSDSKRNPGHIISSSIFLQRGQFIEFQIRFTYNIFLPKKKKLSAKIILTNQNCSFCQIPNTNVIFLTHKRIYMYILQYPVLLVFNYSPLSIKYTLIKFIISCQKCFFFIYFTVQIWETHIPENDIDINTDSHVGITPPSYNLEHSGMWCTLL